MNSSPEQRKVRVLVVDDSAFVRRALIRMLDNHPLIQVIDVASDGEMAVNLVKKLHPDVVTLDVRMPVLDGLSALKRIMTEVPTPVIMLSSLTEKGGENTLKALELGAVDFIDKSAAGGPMEITGIASELVAKILVAARVEMRKLQTSPQETRTEHASRPRIASSGTELVLIGTSTGGPPALQQVLTALPAGFPCPILIVQHMPVGFTASLAERLDRMCALTVKEAEDGETLLAGTAYIAPAGHHLKVSREGGVLRAKLDLEPATALHRPSVDTLLETAATACGGKCLAVVLTGMGKDGAVGAAALDRAGGRVVVESEESAIVFGMPKAVLETVKTAASVPLHKVAKTLLEMV
ncbi:protein-glutamate methylesterase/protein-glutamine glutaminase [Geomobilimonas luticola]|uniref:Protein-glutamate methylesterase/protein-glutamine glutaminase n=1 Tax=Geomobilimonas luticola TaxID=1114878 RepID=A0ABS5SF98_9BACT|nr:chemotaxis response regulator protein-glutamate methylesterase [Geomobilimonas luticola]MBT0653189.1 chemotaxis response regulator protein-glutamate methylesterase [Geomobilimonas luticola]